MSRTNSMSADFSLLVSLEVRIRREGGMKREEGVCVCVCVWIRKGGGMKRRGEKSRGWRAEDRRKGEREGWRGGRRAEIRERRIGG